MCQGSSKCWFLFAPSGPGDSVHGIHDREFRKPWAEMRFVPGDDPIKPAGKSTDQNVCHRALRYGRRFVTSFCNNVCVPRSEAPTHVRRSEVQIVPNSALRKKFLLRLLIAVKCGSQFNGGHRADHQSRRQQAGQAFGGRSSKFWIILQNIDQHTSINNPRHGSLRVADFGHPVRCPSGRFTTHTWPESKCLERIRRTGRLNDHTGFRGGDRFPSQYLPCSQSHFFP